MELRQKQVGLAVWSIRQVEGLTAQEKYWKEREEETQHPATLPTRSWSLWSLYFLLGQQQRHSQLQYIEKWGKWHQMTFSTQEMSNNVQRGAQPATPADLAWHFPHRNSEPATSNKCHPKPNLLQFSPHSVETWERASYQHKSQTASAPMVLHKALSWVPLGPNL